MDEWSFQEQQGQGLRKGSAGAPRAKPDAEGWDLGAGSKKKKAFCQG